MAKTLRPWFWALYVIFKYKQPVHLTGGRLQTKLQAATWWHTDRFGTNSTAKLLKTSRGLGRTHALASPGPTPAKANTATLSTARHGVS